MTSKLPDLSGRALDTAIARFGRLYPEPAREPVTDPAKARAEATRENRPRSLRKRFTGRSR